MEATRYCKPEDVQAFFNDIDFNTNESMTVHKVGALIENWSAYMDGALKPAYALPVSDEADLRILKGICARLTAGEVDDILNPVSANGTHKTRNLKAEGLEMLKSFCSRESLLDGAVSRVSCLVREDNRREY